MKRAIYQAKQIEWPVREEYTYGPTRSTTVELGKLFLLALAITVVFMALVAVAIITLGPR